MPDKQRDDLHPRPRDAAHVTALRYFHEVARAGSIRLAADRLNVASSAISRQIAKLEQEVGVPLFERRPRGMCLTHAGEAYERYARDALLSLRRLRSEIDHLQGLRSGKVRIASIEGLVASFLSEAVSHFRAEHQGVQFETTITSADEVVSSVRAGIADIGLAFNAPTVSGVSFPVRVLDPVAAVMAPSHPLASAKELTLAEIVAEAIAIPVRTFGIRNLLEQACREAHLPLSPTLLTNSIEALRAFARNGDGIAFLHSYAIARELEEGSVVAVPIDAAPLNCGTVDLCVLSERILPVAAREFLAFLKYRFACAERR